MAKPIVKIKQFPANGEHVKGQVTLEVEVENFVQDKMQVEFRLDANLGNLTPYWVERYTPFVAYGDGGKFDSTKIANGGHRLGVVVRDIATKNNLSNLFRDVVIDNPVVVPDPPPLPGDATMAELKGANVYLPKDRNEADGADAARARNEGRMSWVRTDVGNCTPSFLKTCSDVGLKVLPIFCYALGQPSINGDHSFPLDMPLWAQRRAQWVRDHNPLACEIWNEPFVPSFSTGGLNAYEYHRLVRTTRAEIRKTHPKLPIIFSSDEHTIGTSAGTRTWIDPLLKADKENGDVLRNDPYCFPSTHNYCGKQAPEGRSGDYFGRWDIAHIAWGGKQVWVTEIGYDQLSGLSAAVIADFVKRGWKMMLDSKQVAHAFWYQWKKGDPWYGIYSPGNEIVNAFKGL